MTILFALLVQFAATTEAVVIVSTPGELPKGTKIEIRLTSKVASNSSKAGDGVDAVVVAPVMQGDRVAIPMGTKVHGKVKEVSSTAGKTDQRASVLLDFFHLEDSAGKETNIHAKLSEVDNARETVDSSGKIVGILASETLSARMDQGLGKLKEKHSGLADFFDMLKKAVLKEPDPEISYAPGVEMFLELTEKLSLSSSLAPTSASKSVPEVPSSDLSEMVNGQPFRTYAQNPPKPSDVTNLMFLGSRQEIESAFAAAGWSNADVLNSKSGLETFRAIAEQRGYKEAPVSILLLDDQKPGVVFQKQNNTFAKRHHLRIWRRPGTFKGKEIWVSSSTHDSGIEFSPENRTFIHKIDSHIDLERGKVVNDLLFAGKVKDYFLVDRSGVPKDSMNATGDHLLTDGKMAVLVLQ